MAADFKTIIVPTDADLLQAQADLWRHSLYYLTSMALKCAVELTSQLLSITLEELPPCQTW
jgi:hypothetical protein